MSPSAEPLLAQSFHAAPPPLQRLARAIAWRVNLAVWLGRCLGRAAAALGVYAAALLACKVFWPALAIYAASLLAAAPVLLLHGYLECRRKKLFFSRAEIIEIIDHLYRDDGSVSAAFEQPGLIALEPLANDIHKQLAARRPRLRPAYYLKKAAPALGLLALAVALPPRPPAPPAQSQEILTSITQPLAEKIAENEQILPEELRQELLKEVEEIRKSDEGVSKEKWEAVEEMERRVNEAVAQSQNSVTGAVAALSKLADQANVPGNIQGQAEGQQAAEQQVLKDLEAAMRDPKTKLASGMKKEIRELASQMCKGGLSREEMQKRMEELKKKLPGDCGKEPAYRKGENGEGGGNGNKSGPDGDGDPGRGGINRGRGDAPLVFGDAKRAEGASFDQQEVQNNYFSTSDLVDLGIQPIEPKPDPGKFSPGMLRQYDAQSGSQVSRTRISPRQKEVIAKYFSDK